jgi:hypothetical protein
VRTYPFRITPLITAVVLFAAGCKDANTPTTIAAPDATATFAAGAPERPDRFRPGEEHSAALAREIPGFGGFYLDDTGNMHAYLLDLKNERLARAALARTFAEIRRGFGPQERAHYVSQDIFVHQGQYEFGQLADWRNVLIDPVVQIPGVAFAGGIDGQANRVAIGIDRRRPAEVRALVERKLAELGVPRAAVVYDESDLISEECTPEMLVCGSQDNQPPPSDDPCVVDPESCSSDPGTVYPEEPSYSVMFGDMSGGAKTLEHPFPELLGGIRMQNPNVSGGCTLGFVAQWNGRGAWVTNSHCAVNRGYADRSSYFSQPYSGYGVIGQELFDPANKLFGGLYISDVTVVELYNRIGRLGHVARPVANREGIGGSADITVNSADPWMRIKQEVASAATGTYYNKVGATTGWTYGRTGSGRVCVNSSTVTCATWVPAGAARGDSGSPVFQYYGTTAAGTPAGIGLAGLVFAAEEGGFWFTPMAQIRRDLGATGSNATKLRTY